MTALLLVALGTAAGALGSLMGVGGGIVVVPVLATPPVRLAVVALGFGASGQRRFALAALAALALLAAVALLSTLGPGR